MSKKHFIALADMIREYNADTRHSNEVFSDSQITALAFFCAEQNDQFNMPRWLDYIAGKCGPNGGAL